MIENLNSLSTLQAKWHGVIRMRERMDQLVISTFAFDPITSPVFGNILYNLPLQLAFDVLRQALLQASTERQNIGCQAQLGDLMEDARYSLRWIDWQCLREGVQRGYELAYNGKLFGDVQCLQDITNIEAQLLAWGILTASDSSSMQ